MPPSKHTAAGFLVPKGPATGFQAAFDALAAQWVADGCPRTPGTADVFPYPTLAQTVAASTNALYGRPLRACYYWRAAAAAGSMERRVELKCSYADLAQALILRLTDGLQLLDGMRNAPPPPPLPSLNDAPPASSLSIDGCFITSADCGTHGTLVALAPRGCDCVCDAGWQNTRDPSIETQYCACEWGEPCKLWEAVGTCSSFRDSPAPVLLT